MTKPRQCLLRSIENMDLSNPTDEDRDRLLDSGFSFLVYLTEVCGIYDMETDFHDAVTAEDEGNAIFRYFVFYDLTFVMVLFGYHYGFLVAFLSLLCAWMQPLTF